MSDQVQNAAEQTQQNLTAAEAIQNKLGAVKQEDPSMAVQM